MARVSVCFLERRRLTLRKGSKRRYKAEASLRTFVVGMVRATSHPIQPQVSVLACRLKRSFWPSAMGRKQPVVQVQAPDWHHGSASSNQAVEAASDDRLASAAPPAAQHSAMRSRSNRVRSSEPFLVNGRPPSHDNIHSLALLYEVDCQSDRLMLVEAGLF